MFVATLRNQAAKQGAATQAIVTDFTPIARPIVAESTSSSDGFLENLAPNVLADGTWIDWSEWDYLLQDFELQNASFAQI